MSRHRAVRNLDVNGILEDDDDYEEDYYENEFNEDELSNEDLDQLDEGLAYVYSVIGDDTFLTAREIREALWESYFDKEETVEWALDQIEKQKALEEKKRIKEENKKAAASKKATSAPQTKTPISSKTSSPAKQPQKQQQPKSIPSKDQEIEILSDEEDEITQEMNAMGLQAQQEKPTVKADPFAKLPTSKRINVLEEFQKRTDEKYTLNICIIGHVDSGKSTTVGHLMYQLNKVDSRSMRKLEHESQKIGKGSFAFAWALDETEEERNRGVTIDIGTTQFDTEHRHFCILDAPGHRDFIPNMISGTAQADAAVLVVDGSTNAFESGFDAGGQTKEHAILARSLGIQYVIVAINKLDMVDWSKERFEEIKEKLGAYLYQVGFKKSNVMFIPISGLMGENLVERSKAPALTQWYDGPSLAEQLDTLPPPTRAVEKPLRMRVTDFFKGGVGSSGGVSVAGNIEAGTIQLGEQVLVVPGNEVGYVKTLLVNDEPAQWAAAGDSVLLTLSNLDILNLSNGCMICSGTDPVPLTSTFEAQIVVFDIRIPITPGYPVILHHGSLDEPASITKLISIVDKATGEVTKKNPRCITRNMTATVQVKMNQRPIPLETFKDNKQLGRIVLRRGGDTVAAGVVTEILTYGS